MVELQLFKGSQNQIPYKIWKGSEGNVGKLADPGHSRVCQSVTELPLRKVDDDLAKSHA